MLRGRMTHRSFQLFVEFSQPWSVNYVGYAWYIIFSFCSVQCVETQPSRDEPGRAGETDAERAWIT